MVRYLGYGSRAAFRTFSGNLAILLRVCLCGLWLSQRWHFFPDLVTSTVPSYSVPILVRLQPWIPAFGETCDVSLRGYYTGQKLQRWFWEKKRCLTLPDRSNGVDWLNRPTRWGRPELGFRWLLRRSEYWSNSEPADSSRARLKTVKRLVISLDENLRNERSLQIMMKSQHIL